MGQPQGATWVPGGSPDLRVHQSTSPHPPPHARETPLSFQVEKSGS